MTILRENYWLSNKNWWHSENLKPVINDDAPKEAKESYKRFIAEQEAARKRGVL